jgi:hypothetical protein
MSEEEGALRPDYVGFESWLCSYWSDDGKNVSFPIPAQFSHLKNEENYSYLKKFWEMDNVDKLTDKDILFIK